MKELNQNELQKLNGGGYGGWLVGAAFGAALALGAPGVGVLILASALIVGE